MTSSERHLLLGQPRWNYAVQQYKPYRDVFCEKGLTSILFLACGRHQTTRRCLLSTMDAIANCPLEIEWIFMENGQDNDNFHLFQDLSIERKVIIRQRNFGINEAWNQMWALSRGEFIMIHENDFECHQNIDFLSIANDIMNEQPDVGVVQLRAVNDPCENWGYRKPEYSPWSSTHTALENAKIKVWKEHTKKGHPYFLSIFPNGFNNNPCLIRKSLYRECGPYPESEVGTDPRYGETFYQGLVAQTGCTTAHIGIELYYHGGQITTKAN